MSEFEFVPQDRTMKREVYYALRKLWRRIFWEHREEIKAEALKQMRNFYIYGTTHPEAYKHD